MALGSTLKAQFGWSKEVTVGTRVAQADFAEFTGEGIRHTINPLTRKGMKAGRLLPHGKSQGSHNIGGNTTLDLSAETLGSLFELMIGDVSTTGAGPYVHTFKPGDLHTASVQFNRPDPDGADQAYDYLGAWINGWEIQFQPDSFVTLSLDWLAQEEDATIALETASYAQTNFFTFTHAVVSIASSEIATRELTVTADNALDTQMYARTTGAGLPVHREAGQRTYGGTLTVDSNTDLVAYNRFLNGTVADVTVVATLGTNILTMGGDVWFTGETPNASSPDEIIGQVLPFEFTSVTDDETAFTAVLTNDDATP